MDIVTLVQNKQREMAAKKQRATTLKPLAGDHKYRILPGWRGSDDMQFWHDFGIHFIKSPTSAGKPEAVYVCAEKTYGKPCDICASIQDKIANCTDDTTLEFLNGAKSAQRYLMNVLHLTGPEPTKVQVLEVNKTVFEAICALIPEYKDITSLTQGTDLRIKREGSGLDTRYTVIPAKESSTVSASLLANLTNMDDFVALENPLGQTKALNALGSIIGISHSAPASAPRASHPALADLSDADDAEFTPVAAPMKAVVGSDLTADDLDDLDDLLG